MKQFNHIAKYIKTQREAVELSQTELATAIGYKNGQFISNVERGLCSLPLCKIKPTAQALRVNSDWIAEEIVKDFMDTVAEALRES